MSQEVYRLFYTDSPQRKWQREQGDRKKHLSGTVLVSKITKSLFVSAVWFLVCIQT